MTITGKISETAAKKLQQSGRKPIWGVRAPGQLSRGTVDLTKRPQVKNRDGSVSTVRSIGISEGDRSVLIPTVVGNKVVSNDEAIKHYQKTGEHLGTFKDDSAAEQYAKTLHESQAAVYPKKPQNANMDVSARTAKKMLAARKGRG